MHQLSASVQGRDEESEALVEKLSAGELDLEAFVKDYLKTRSQFYSLQMKVKSATSSFSS